MYLKQIHPRTYKTTYFITGLFLTLFVWGFLGQVPYVLFYINDRIALETNHNLSLFLLLSGNLLGLSCLLLWIRKVHKLEIIKLFTSRKKFDFGRFWFIFLLWFAFILLETLFSIFVEGVAYEFRFNILPFIFLFFISVLLVPFQIAFEEILFRGYLMQGLYAQTGKRLFSFLIPTLSFAFFHVSNLEIQQLGWGFMWIYILTSLLLGVMVIMDDGLELSLGFHLANNMAILLLVNNNWSSIKTDAPVVMMEKPDVLISSVFMTLIYGLLLYILSKKYKWTHWRTKFLGSF